MADVHTPEQRRYNMQQIRSTNTKPEMLVRKFLHAQGFRYRLHGGKPAAATTFAKATAVKKASEGKPNTSPRSGKVRKKHLPGKPDIVLPKYHTVIFIHGCFWHGHARCKYYRVPKTRTDWWLNKINTNKANDAKAVKALKKEGWNVIVVWECGLKTVKMEKTLASLLKKVKL